MLTVPDPRAEEVYVPPGTKPGARMAASSAVGYTILCHDTILSYTMITHTMMSYDVL